MQDFCQSDKDNEREMRVIDLINSNEKTAFSFEILPPLKGTGIEKLYQTIDTLREFDPKYINITTHRSEYVYKDLGNGLFQRNRLRRRPGTVARSCCHPEQVQHHHGARTILCQRLHPRGDGVRAARPAIPRHHRPAGASWRQGKARILFYPPWATVTTTPSNYKSKSTTSIKVFLWTAPR